MIPPWKSQTEERSRSERLLGTLDGTLDRLAEATPLARTAHIQEVVRLADHLRRDDVGLNGLAERAPRLHELSFFDGTPWQHLDRLVGTLVAGDLAAGGHYAVMETLSCLRVLAVAEGRIPPAGPEGVFDAEEANAFLEEVVALNAWALFPGETEASRADPLQAAATERLFRLLIGRLSDPDLLSIVLDEVDQVSAQRPIMVDTLVDRIRLAEQLAKEHGGKDPRLVPYVRALDGPGPMSRQTSDEGKYRELLERAGEKKVLEEVTACAESVRRTGLVSRQHVWLVQWAAHEDADLLDLALGLDERGRLERRLNHDLVLELIDSGTSGATAQEIDGLGRTLERGLLSRPEVAGGLRRLLELELHPEVEGVLKIASTVEPRHRLLGGALRVLGRPLGIGQGRNPTCQAARGISLWSLNRPGYLLELTATAARDNQIGMWFLGDIIDSGDLLGGLMDEMHPELDPVSLVLVPHLDRLYGEMMRRVANRPEDGHKWVNPAMYGRMVAGAMASVFSPLTGQPYNVREFVTKFYVTHHPAHAAAHGLTYPNPVGLIVTSAHAAFVGFHAVTIQRIAKDPKGVTRVYFFNPNNEGRQDWGDDIVPSVMDHGEVAGESSLPFEQFTSRLYAFHYDPYWVGRDDSVTDEEIDRVMARIEKSWMKTGPWAQGLL